MLQAAFLAGQGTGPTPQRRNCNECNGHHPGEKACPNNGAKAEGMDPIQLQNSGLKCSYQATEGEPVCEGVGHLRRHHEKKSDKGKGKRSRGKCC